MLVMLGRAPERGWVVASWLCESEMSIVKPATAEEEISMGHKQPYRKLELHFIHIVENSNCVSKCGSNTKVM